MRILRLDLIAFGPFTGRSFALDEGRYGLHVICGPNEAGKSSALRALSDLLYGVPARSTDNFLHPHPKMRIGGLLESRDGAQLEVVRRKGKSKTLLDADGEVIDDALLTAMLGRFERNDFQNRFGLNCDRLRAGGRALIEGRGDLGEALFAAGAGVADLRDVQNRLAEEMDALFKPSGRNPKINAQLAELQQAEIDVQDALTSPEQYDACKRALQEAELRNETLDAELRERRAQKSRLQRVARALPQIVRRNQRLEQFREVADAPRLSDDFPELRRKATGEREHAEKDRLAAVERFDALRAARETLQADLPETLLRHRARIEDLRARGEVCRSAADDRRERLAERRQAQRNACAILEELGSEPDLAQADRFQLGRGQRRRIHALAGECQALTARRDAAARQLEKNRSEVALFERQAAEAPAPRDPELLRQAIRRAERAGDPDARIGEIRGELRRLEEPAAAGLRSLTIFDGDLAALERLPVPSRETVDRFELELGEARGAIAELEKDSQARQDRRRDLQRRLDALEQQQGVPTEDDLREARARRDEGWRLVCDAWLRGAEATAATGFVEQFAPGGDLPSAFARCVERADDVADRLRREADRVAEKATLLVEQQDVARRIEDLAERLAAAQRRLSETDEGWRTAWAPADVTPLSPNEMRAWLEERAALIEIAEQVRLQLAQLAETEATRTRHCAELDERLAELGESTAGDADSLTATVERAAAALATIEAAALTRRERETELVRLEDELPRSEDARRRAEEALVAWRREWGEAVEPLGMAPDADAEQVNAALELVDELTEKLRIVQDKGERVAEIDASAERLAEDVRQLNDLVADDLPDDLAGASAPQIVAALVDRLAAGVVAETQCKEREAELRREQDELQDADERIQRWDAEVAQLCRDAECASADELPKAERRAADRKRLENELAEIDERLAELAAGAELEQFVHEALACEGDAIDDDLARADEEIERLQQQREATRDEAAKRRVELEAIDGGDRAAVAQEKAEQTAAAVRSDCEQYVRLALASTALRRVIERFREKTQDPAVARGSELFAQLTLGSFEGLRSDYDDAGRPVLVGVRPGGDDVVGLDGMSEGTADQLYLALRLALLESHLQSGAEPMPLVVDDLLVMFDDRRAAAALKILAALSQKTQVVFFTHHPHLVRLAEETLDDDVLFVHAFEGHAPEEP